MPKYFVVTYNQDKYDIETAVNNNTNIVINDNKNRISKEDKIIFIQTYSDNSMAKIIAHSDYNLQQAYHNFSDLPSDNNIGIYNKEYFEELLDKTSNWKLCQRNHYTASVSDQLWNPTNLAINAFGGKQNEITEISKKEYEDLINQCFNVSTQANYWDNYIKKQMQTPTMQPQQPTTKTTP